MSFAIFYQDSYAQFIADALNRSDLTNKRQTATKIYLRMLGLDVSLCSVEPA